MGVYERCVFETIRIESREPMRQKRQATKLLKIIMIINYMFLFIFVGILAPLEIKEISPRAWGWVEGKLGWDLTGFWFTPIGGNGKCRIINSAAAFSLPGSCIIFGEITPLDRKPYPHLWVELKGKIVDEVCPPENPECRVRRQFATVDTISLQIVSQSSRSNTDFKGIKWGLEYLAGLKSALVPITH